MNSRKSKFALPSTIKAITASTRGIARIACGAIPPRSLAIACCLAALINVNASAQDFHAYPPEPVEGLQNLYYDDAVLDISSICTQRFPQESKDWDKALLQWKKNNRDVLAELKNLQIKIDVAVREKSQTPINLDAFATIVASRLSAETLPSQLIAPLPDKDAMKYCDDSRLGYLNNPLDPQMLVDARNAVNNIIHVLQR